LIYNANLRVARYLFFSAFPRALRDPNGGLRAVGSHPVRLLCKRTKLRTFRFNGLFNCK